MGKLFESGKGMLSPSQGMHFFEWALAESVNQVTIVAPEYLQFMLSCLPDPLPFWVQGLSSVLKQYLLEEDTKSRIDLSKIAPVEREEFIRQFIHRHLRRILHLKDSVPISDIQGFFEMGFDSIMAMELQVRLSKELGLSEGLRPTFTFDYPNIERLAQYVKGLVWPAEKEVISRVIYASAAEPIAVIGMGCRFPEAPNVDAFWKLLYEGQEGISEVPKERWESSAYYDINAETRKDVDSSWRIFKRDRSF